MKTKKDDPTFKLLRKTSKKNDDALMKAIASIILVIVCGLASVAFILSIINTVDGIWYKINGSAIGTEYSEVIISEWKDEIIQEIKSERSVDFSANFIGSIGIGKENKTESKGRLALYQNNANEPILSLEFDEQSTCQIDKPLTITRIGDCTQSYIGINNNNPQAQLDVNGNVVIHGNVTIYGTLIYSGSTCQCNGTSGSSGNAISIQGVNVSSTAPTSNQVILYNSTTWNPTTLTAPIISYTPLNPTLWSPVPTTIQLALDQLITRNGTATPVNESNAVSLQGIPIYQIAPTPGQLLLYNGSYWMPGVLSSAGVSYSPANPTLWLPVPTNVGSALDQLASKNGSSSAPNNQSNAIAIQYIPVSPTGPTINQVLFYNGTSWNPTTLTAPVISYTPSNSALWSPVPTTVQLALDQLITRNGTNTPLNESNAVSLQGIPISTIPPSLGQYLGYNGTVWIPVSSVNQNPSQSTLIVNVDKSGNNSNADGTLFRPYLTISAALTSITDASSIKRYAIRVGPGVFNETDISLKPWVWISGNGDRSTYISSASGAIHLDTGLPVNGSFEAGVLSVYLVGLSNIIINTTGFGAGGSLYFTIRSIYSDGRIKINGRDTDNFDIWDSSVGFIDITGCFVASISGVTVTSRFYTDTTSLKSGQNLIVQIVGSYMFDVVITGAVSSNFIGLFLAGCFVSNSFTTTGLIAITTDPGSVPYFAVLGSGAEVELQASAVYVDYLPTFPGAWPTVPDTVGEALDLLANTSQNGNAVKIQGIPVSPTTPTTNQVLGYTGTQWAPYNLFNPPNSTLSIYVDKSGNDSTATGSLSRPFLTIVGAISSITTDSMTNRYVINIGPGIFNETGLTLKPWVWLQGSGGRSTNIILLSPLVYFTNLQIYQCGMSDLFLSSGSVNLNSSFISYNGSLHLELSNLISEVSTFNISGYGFQQERVYLTNVNITNLRVSAIGTFIMQGSFLSGQTLFDDYGFGSPPNEQQLQPSYYINGNTFLNTFIINTGNAENSAQFDYYLFGCLMNVFNFTLNGSPSVTVDVSSMPFFAIGIDIEENVDMIFASQAQYLTYSAAVHGNWSPVPTNVASALDQLASRVGNALEIQGIPVSATTPTTNQVLGYNGAQWIPYNVFNPTTSTFTIYVDKSGSDSTGTGSISRPYLTATFAMSTITSSSSTNRYIINIGPGVFSESSLTLKPWTWIQGAGGKATSISLSNQVVYSGLSAGLQFSCGLQNLYFTLNGITLNSTIVGTTGSVNLVIDNIIVDSYLVVIGRGSFSHFATISNSNFGSIQITDMDLLYLFACICSGTSLFQNSLATTALNYQITSSQFATGQISGTNILTLELGACSFTQLSLSGTFALNTDVNSIPFTVTSSGTPSITLNSLASFLFYIPTVTSAWSPQPVSVSSALDQLANKTGSATKISYTPTNSSLWNPVPTTVQTALDELINKSANANAEYLRGTIISTTAPTTNQILAYSGTQWAPTSTVTVTSVTIGSGTALSTYTTGSQSLTFTSGFSTTPSTTAKWTIIGAVVAVSFTGVTGSTTGTNLVFTLPAAITPTTSRSKICTRVIFNLYLALSIVLLSGGNSVFGRMAITGGTGAVSINTSGGYGSGDTGGWVTK
jgi:hypothetical protein